MTNGSPKLACESLQSQIGIRCAQHKPVEHGGQNGHPEVTGPRYGAARRARAEEMRSKRDGCDAVPLVLLPAMIRQIPHSCKWPQVKLRKSIFIPPTTSNASHEPWRFKILFKKFGCFVHRLGFSPSLTRAIPAVEFCPLPCIWPSPRQGGSAVSSERM